MKAYLAITTFLYIAGFVACILKPKVTKEQRANYAIKALMQLAMAVWALILLTR